MKKTLLIILFILMPVIAFAGQKSLTATWEQDNATMEGVAGWDIFYSTAPLPDNCTSCTVLVNIPYIDGQTTYGSPPVYFGAPDGAETTFYFAAEAYDQDNNRSGISNVVSYVVDFEAPSRPFDFQVVITDVP